MEEFLIDGQTVSNKLIELAENSNKSFTESLHPGIENILGVRIPDLRKLAQRIARSNWSLYLEQAGTYFMEERILYGLVLGYIQPDIETEKYLQRVTHFVHLINSWSVCDTFSFGGGRTWLLQNSDKLWPYLKGWMTSSGEYQVRFGIVMARKYFVDEIHLRELLQFLDQIKHDGYYVKMAVAWAISDCYVKFPCYTMEFLKYNNLDDFTFNKSLQKIIESFRVDVSDKLLIKKMKRK